jgi:Holliday junction resolvase RusA-like endonuclease
MLKSKEYVVNFAPISWKRSGKNGKRFYDTQAHEKLATGFHLIQQHGQDPKFLNPVEVELVFHMPIPKSVAKRKKTTWYPSTPDIDNLQKFIFDTITGTGVIWKDDCIICSLNCKKIYDNNPRTYIKITELE